MRLPLSSSSRRFLRDGRQSPMSLFNMDVSGMDRVRRHWRRSSSRRGRGCADVGDRAPPGRANRPAIGRDIASERSGSLSYTESRETRCCRSVQPLPGARPAASMPPINISIPLGRSCPRRGNGMVDGARAALAVKTAVLKAGLPGCPSFPLRSKMLLKEFCGTPMPVTRPVEYVR